MSWIDWLIALLPVAFVMYMAFHTRRYIRGVSDYLAAGRVAHRYVISVGDLANALSIIGLLTYLEMHYKTGFSVTFWSSILAPLSIVLSLTGYCMYRFRETRAMSLGQFLEIRYSRKLRIFAAALRSLAEMLANMIMPALAARFFMQMLDLPNSFHFLWFNVPVYPLLLIVFLTLAITIICMGGTLALLITDTLQGMILYPLLVFFILFVLYKFSVTQEIMPVMMDRVAGESFLNPYDLKKLRDFNVFTLVVVGAYSTIMGRASWIGAGYSCAAVSPHEQKMASLLGGWRGTLVNIFYVLIACTLIAFLNHEHFSSQALAVRKNLIKKVAMDIFANDTRTQKVLLDAAGQAKEQKHHIGKEAPLSQNDNLDFRFLDGIHTALKADAKQKALGVLEAKGIDVQSEEAKRALIDAEGQANDKFQQCRTLYNQQTLSVTMRHLLPSGMFGMFVLLLILAMISTDDTRIYSAALTIAQDVVLPLKKKPFTPQGHVWMIRWVTIGIGVFFFFGSMFMKQLDYIHMFVTLVCAMWCSGCGPVMVFGLYSRTGTTAAAWASLLTSTVMSVAYTLIQRGWADVVYPAIAKAGLVEQFDTVLRTLSKPFGTWITWQMDPVKCPVNSVEFAFFLSVFCLILYIVVSKFTCKEPFNLEQMLHRGKYAVAEEEKKDITQQWTFGNILKNIIGITPEYTRGDKLVAYGIFCHSFIYGFIIMFVGVVVWNTFSPWPLKYWSIYFIILHLLVPGIIAFITTFWFGIGGIIDMRRLFKDLAARTHADVLDDGRVEGNMSLADKARMEREAKQAENKNE